MHQRVNEAVPGCPSVTHRISKTVEAIFEVQAPLLTPLLSRSLSSCHAVPSLLTLALSITVTLYRPLLYNLPLQIAADPTTKTPHSNAKGAEKGVDVCVTVKKERQREILSR